MGTFHQGKSELHGITVVVDTSGPAIYVGRCDDMDDSGIILLDADVHEESDGGRSKAEYVERAAQFGPIQAASAYARTTASNPTPGGP